MSLSTTSNYKYLIMPQKGCISVSKQVLWKQWQTLANKPLDIAEEWQNLVNKTRRKDDEEE